ncbi:3-carboxy-cis,cis-muconate cycloisomerase [Yoonia vestfoldensis]|jgi:3-carboxy-cis,cis-muconate cycloisomerase|uniref:3-carboxy-cis,cis-muconate cycloisomerase n=1 Tax=Yoonia vestfoldensis SKA53 TaxID=314232 RepID=A3V8P3_9RHOB|nr:3-carboxy-cis,cis-muconate cycloisomerase [Yoonia vestfoldensis]EAQ05474.1 3-carboxy-cis,cis-muconate cycloisomerase [Yoonia vestfoldensis SKA53]
MTNAFTTSGLFGGLLCDPAIAQEFDAPAFTARMLAFEAAWTQALGTCGVVPADDAETALTAIKAFSNHTLGQGSDRDGLPVPDLVAALKSDLSSSAARAVHTGATSQDVIDTAMVLTCLAVMDRLTDRLHRVIAALESVLARFGDAPLTARTRMQAALPATIALRVAAWRRPLADHLARAVDVRAQLAFVQIGGPIGTREMPQIHVAECAGRVAATLGLSLGPVWHTDRSRIIALGHWLALVAGSLGKIGQDVALMAQQGVDEISLSGGGVSSAMAHKQNPIGAEMMVALARYVAGQQGILGQAMIHEQERSGAAWALEWLTLPAMAEATGATLNHAESLIASIERIGIPD